MGIKLYNKATIKNGMYTTAQDINGTIYVKCNDCNETMVPLMDYRNGRRRWIYRCPKCNSKVNIDL